MAPISAVYPNTAEGRFDGVTPLCRAMSEAAFAARVPFDAAIAARSVALFADAANDTDATPVLQVGTLSGDVQQTPSEQIVSGD